MLVSHGSTLQKSVPMLSCHVHPECPWPGFLIRSSQTAAHGFCSPPNQEVMSKYILWLLRSCFVSLIYCFPAARKDASCDTEDLITLDGRHSGCGLPILDCKNDGLICTVMSLRDCNHTVKKYPNALYGQPVLFGHPSSGESVQGGYIYDNNSRWPLCTRRPSHMMSGHHLLVKIVQTEYGWPRPGHRLLFEETEVVPLSWSWWETNATQRTSSSWGSAVRPWSLP